MTTEGERLATVEAMLHDVRGDVLEVKQEAQLARNRLHKVEGGLDLLLSHDRLRANIAEDRNKRNDRRLRVLAALAAFAAIIQPFILYYVTKR